MQDYETIVCSGGWSGPLPRIVTDGEVQIVLRRNAAMTEWVLFRGVPWKRLPRDLRNLIRGMVCWGMHGWKLRRSFPGGGLKFSLVSMQLVYPDGFDRPRADWDAATLCFFFPPLEGDTYYGPRGVSAGFYTERDKTLLAQWRKPARTAADERARQSILREERERDRAKRHVNRNRAGGVFRAK